MSAFPDLGRRPIQPEHLAEMALDDEKLLHELLQGISPDTKKMALRENCSKALRVLAENWPEILLPHWDYFIGLLKSRNGFSKMAAIYVLVSLVPVDADGRFEKSFDTFYNLLDDESVMVASHTAGVSARIVWAKPALQSRITKRLLEIERTHFEPGRRDLVKSYIIETFDQYCDESKDRGRIIEFVKQQVECSSPKTRKLAREFLRKRDVVDSA